MRLSAQEADLVKELYKCLDKAFNIAVTMKASVDISEDKHRAKMNGMRLCIVDEDGNICLEV